MTVLPAESRYPTTTSASLNMNSALDKLYNELLNEAEQGEPEEITDAERAKRFLEEKQVTIDKLREVRMWRIGLCVTHNPKVTDDNRTS